MIGSERRTADLPDVSLAAGWLARIRRVRFGLVMLGCWIISLVAFALLPEGYTGSAFLTSGVSLTAEAFVVVAFTISLLRIPNVGRLFSILFGGALVIRYLGEGVSWVGSESFGGTLAHAIQIAAYAASDLVLFGLLCWLVAHSRREMALVTFLDVSAVMLSSGLLLWHFLIGPTVAASSQSDWEVIAALTQTVSDIGLLFLALYALMGARFSFVLMLAGGLVLLLASDGTYLSFLANESRGLGGWYELMWAGGALAVGLAVLRYGTAGCLMHRPQVGDFGTVLFWLGPLSPPLQYGGLLLWGSFGPSLPSYVLWSGTGLLLIFAMRTCVVSRASWRVTGEQTVLAKRTEQTRLLRELHDTAKQSMTGTSMLLEACAEAHNKGNRAAVGRLLRNALAASREAKRQLSEPLDELRFFGTGNVVSPTAFFCERLKQFGQDFGMTTHADLKVPLETLKREELIVAHRVCTEAAWNSAKHSGARNLWLETRRTGSSLVLEMRDDGRGFTSEKAADGMGLGFMHSRAEEVGAVLEVISASGEGTTVRLRFGER